MKKINFFSAKCEISCGLAELCISPSHLPEIQVLFLLDWGEEYILLVVLGFSWYYEVQ